MRVRLHPPEPPTGQGIFGLPYGPDESLVHILPVPFEATVSYRAGTAKGPAAIREASEQVDLLDPDVGRPHRCGIWMHPESPAVRRWNREARAAALPVIEVLGEIDGDPSLRRKRALVDERGAALNRWLENETDRLLDAGRIVGVVGGDHSTPFGAIRAHARRFGSIGILHVDAHADLRRAYEGFTWSHASIMDNVTRLVPEVTRIVQVGIRDFCDEEADRIRSSKGRIVPFLDADLRERKMRGEPFQDVADEVIGALPKNVYVSFDVDGLDPSLCPHTGTPVPGGLDFPEAVGLLMTLVRSGRRIVGFDLNEVAPAADDDWDANVGARLLHKLIGATLLTRTTAYAR